MEESGVVDPTLIRFMGISGRNSPNSVLPFKNISLKSHEYNAHSSPHAVQSTRDRKINTDSDLKLTGPNELMGRICRFN